MYEYVDDKKTLGEIRSLCGHMMQDLCHTLKEKYNIGASFSLVGSGARNLVLQNKNEPIDLDYNLEIIKTDDFKNCCHIKECARKAFDKVLNKYHWRSCKDSTSSLTTERRYLPNNKSMLFSMDVCIVYRDTKDNYHRLIHQKLGTLFRDNYFWNQEPNSSELKKKSKYIKNKGKWQRVREEYKQIKNRYLTSNNHSHPSFKCYIEAVNNVYNSIR